MDKMPSRVFIILFLVLLFDSIAYALINPIITQILIESIKDIELPDKLVYQDAFITSLPFFLSPAYLLAGPVVGWLSDRWGRRKLLLCTFSMTCLAFIILLLNIVFHHLVLGLFATFLLSLQVVNFPLVHAAIADISQGKQRAYYIAGLFIACSLSMAFIMRMMDITVTVTFFSDGFIVIASIGLLFELIGLMLIYFKFPETHPVTQNSNEESHLLTGIASIFNNKQLLSTLTALLLLYFGWGLFEQSVSHYLANHLQFNHQQINILMLSTLFCMLLTLLFLYPFLLRKFSLTQILSITLSITALSILGVSITESTILQWVFNNVFGIAIAINFACLWTLLVNGADTNSYGITTGIANCFWVLGWIASNGLIILCDHRLTELLLVASCTVFLAVVPLIMPTIKVLRSD